MQTFAIWQAVLLGLLIGARAVRLHMQSKHTQAVWLWVVIVTPFLLWPFIGFGRGVALLVLCVMAIQICRTQRTWSKLNPRNYAKRRPEEKRGIHLLYRIGFYLAIAIGSILCLLGILHPGLLLSTALGSCLFFYVAPLLYKRVGEDKTRVDKLAGKKETEGQQVTWRERQRMRRHSWAAPTVCLVAGILLIVLSFVLSHRDGHWTWWVTLAFVFVCALIGLLLQRQERKAEVGKTRTWRLLGMVVGTLLIALMLSAMIGATLYAFAIANKSSEGNGTETTDVVAESEDNKCSDTNQISANTPHWGKSATTIFRIYPLALAFALEEKGLITSDEATTIQWQDPEGGCLTEEARELYDKLIAENTEQELTELWQRYCNKETVICPGEPD